MSHETCDINELTDAFSVSEFDKIIYARDWSKWWKFMSYYSGNFKYHNLRHRNFSPENLFTARGLVPASGLNLR